MTEKPWKVDGIGAVIAAGLQVVNTTMVSPVLVLDEET